MSDSTDEIRDDHVTEDTARIMRDLGLTGPAFDLDATVVDVRARLAADASLDDLIGQGEPS